MRAAEKGLLFSIPTSYFGALDLWSGELEGSMVGSCADMWCGDPQTTRDSISPVFTAA